MILCVANVLSVEQLADVCAALDSGPFNAGLESTEWAAQSVKRTLRLDTHCPAHERLSHLVRNALSTNETIQAAALPHTFSAMHFGRADPGMGYGPHVDSAVIGTPRLRTDLAFTLFLSDIASYEGGELVITGNEGDEEIKLPAGALVMYPATSMHRVRVVRSGRRFVCAGWIQSLVRDPRVREMIYDLSRVKMQLLRERGNSELFDLVCKTQANLLRLHAEL
jgi:PKHD-type hydroxylase